MVVVNAYLPIFNSRPVLSPSQAQTGGKVSKRAQTPRLQMESSQGRRETRHAPHILSRLLGKLRGADHRLKTSDKSSFTTM